MSSTVEARARQRLVGGGDGPGEHGHRIDAGQGEGVEPGPGRSPSSAAFSSLMMSAAEAPSVIWLELPAVTLPSGLNAGLRLASVSAGRALADALVGGDHLVGLGDCAGLLVGGSSARGTISCSKRPSAVARAARALALGGEGVELLAGQAPLVGDQLGRDALGHQPAHVGVALVDPGAERHAELAVADRGAHRHLAHDLDAGGDTTSWAPAMTAWAAKWAACCDEPHWRSTVVAGTSSGQPGGQHGVAADVDRLGAGLHDAAHDHVVDQRRDRSVALDQGVEGLGGQVGRVPPRQLAVALAPGGADGIDDHGGGHGAAPLSSAPAPLPVAGQVGRSGPRPFGQASGPGCGAAAPRAGELPGGAEPPAGRRCRRGSMSRSSPPAASSTTWLDVGVNGGGPWKTALAPHLAKATICRRATPRPGVDGGGVHALGG